MAAENGISVLEISGTVNGNPRVIYPTIIWDQDNVILVDAGFPGQLPIFREAVEKLDIPFGRINKIIITHQDFDHIGGLPDLVNNTGVEVEVLSHSEEKPLIQGDLKFVKKPQAERERNEAASPEAASWATFRAAAEKAPRAKVTRVVSDGEELPYSGGIVVIHTPGHTPGHIALYHKQSKTLVSGDALNVFDGVLGGPNPQHTHDQSQALASLKKLSDYNIQSVITYHGGLFQGDANERIAEIANS